MDDVLLSGKICEIIKSTINVVAIKCDNDEHIINCIINKVHSQYLSVMTVGDTIRITGKLKDNMIAVNLLEFV